MATIVIPANESLQTAEEVLKETAIASVVEVLTEVDSESDSGRSFTASHTSTLRCNVQEPIAVVGMSCRLPGHCTSIDKFWNFISTGSIAQNDVPQSRWRLDGHHDGSAKPHTIRSPGGMFLEDIDLHAVDAQFFNLSRADAIAMDPQQRQLLEVVVECLENSGITLESISDKQVGCFTASYAVDFADMQARNPEEKPESFTIGTIRASLSNRISHFLNIKGPSMTIDTACSGGLVSVDTACRYLHSGQAEGCIVTGANIYLSPEHIQDMGTMRGVSSTTGRCHTFDEKADGYIKAEGVNAVFLKRLDDAIRDGNPIRAVIRATSTNSDGWTPGISNPSSEAQARNIRMAYANADIDDFNETGYLECHGTGTPAGDPAEVEGVGSVFGPSRNPEDPLIVGSIKSNIGHSEPAAGLSGLIKAVLAVERGSIPGNPTFVHPNPNIDFDGLRVRATRRTINWPEATRGYRRASVNSSGYVISSVAPFDDVLLSYPISKSQFCIGGSNGHAILDCAQHFLSRNQIQRVARQVSSFGHSLDDQRSDDVGKDGNFRQTGPKLLTFSANDEYSLRAYIKSLSAHLADPSVNVRLSDLAHTLSEHRSRHYQRAFTVVGAQPTEKLSSIVPEAAVFGKRAATAPRLGFVFTGQGAQWPQMGRELLALFPMTAGLAVDLMHHALQGLPAEVRPVWTLRAELSEPRSPEHIRRPEFAQPLATALQVAMLAVLGYWGVRAGCVVGHSSGEVAAAYAAGLLTREQAIKIAYFRGLAAKLTPPTEPVGMMAVGLGGDTVRPYLDLVNAPGGGAAEVVQVACFNSPSSSTLSGTLQALETVRDALKKDGHFARMLQVDMAYHSRYVASAGKRYDQLFQQYCTDSAFVQASCAQQITMFSSLTGDKLDADEKTDWAYWKGNLFSPVRFEQECRAMLLDGNCSADFLIEIGPSNALAGPVSQICKALPSTGADITYTAAASRGPDTILSLFGVAGRLFLAGGDVALSKVNKEQHGVSFPQPAFIVDLPNYAWNHTVKYWEEGESSKDWRFRRFSHHDLLGSKILGTSWETPSWKKYLRLEDVPWLEDHKMGPDIVFPGAAYIAMAVEAAHQRRLVLATEEETGHLTSGNYHFRLRDLKFRRALVLGPMATAKLMLTMHPVAGSDQTWLQYKVWSLGEDEAWDEHHSGLITISLGIYKGQQTAAPESLALPLRSPTPGRMWYKAMQDAGYNFGPSFQKHLAVETTLGERYSRSVVSLDAPASKWSPQSDYPLHPACMDGFFQTTTASLWEGDRSSMNAVLIPSSIDSVIVAARPRAREGVVVTRADYIGTGRHEDKTNYSSQGTMYNPVDGAVMAELKGVHYSRLETRADVYTSYTYLQTSWKPDLSLLKDDAKFHKALGLYPDESIQDAVQSLIDLAAYKNPSLAVLEFNLSPGNGSSLWLSRPVSECAIRAAYRSYHLSISDPKALLDSQERYATAADNIEFSLSDPMRLDFTPPSETFDLVVVKVPQLVATDLELLGRNIRRTLGEDGSALIIETQPVEACMDSCDVGKTLSSAGLTNIRNFCRHGYLAGVSSDNQVQSGKRGDIVLLRLSSGHIGNEGVVSVLSSLRDLGWTVDERNAETTESTTSKSTVLVLDELEGPVLSTASKTQWDCIKQLVRSECSIFWVTLGSQMAVTDPETSIIHGIFRTIRAEEPALKLMTLDVESVASAETLANTVEAVDTVLKMIREPLKLQHNDFEYAERGGVLHINRVLQNENLNRVKFEEVSQGTMPTRRVDIHDMDTTVRLVTEQSGSLDSLHYVEVEPNTEIGPDAVEVQLHAAAVNFKDVAVAMGIVPEDGHLLGVEGAGVILRKGENVRDRHIGQRVVVFEKGTFANRIVASARRTFPIPATMSFEDATTLPAVYLTSVYGLHRLANIKAGQSVLIHCASGGVGIAAIQLCQHRGCDIFATAGTEVKRRFLIDTFGIQPDHVFSSRTAEFATGIMAATNSRGVDVILNSLAGELLNETWRIIADGGTMVELGKKDILAKNNLPMEPFGRNASFRAMDLSYREISDDILADMFVEIFNLLEHGHVKPISPRQVFSWDSVPAACRTMRGSKHIGKLVISNGPDAKVDVQVCPTRRKLSSSLDPRESYLIVGGLRGVCGSLALHMAKTGGARHLAVMCRSGYDDDRSQEVIRNLEALGCSVDRLIGDVAVLGDVRRCFADMTVPVAGIIQGAMVLRDRMFASMTHADYHDALRPKVQGSWNLHVVSLEQAQPLRFFTLLSSASGIVGNMGQANYAGASVYLDALASYRRDHLKLPACAVDLGVIEDVGYVAAHGDVSEKLGSKQWATISEGLLRRILEYSIYQQDGQRQATTASSLSPPRMSSAQIVTGIPVPQPSGSELLRDARFAGLHTSSSRMNTDAERSSSAGTQEDAKAIKDLLLALRVPGGSATSPDVQAAALAVLQRRFAQTLRLDESDMVPSRPPRAYGLDSLAAVELRNWARAALGVQLTSLDIVNAGSMVALCGKILDRMVDGKS